ncbi:hypothetical protein SHIRM173S_05221 [Streptomyces hirsutus]
MGKVEAHFAPAVVELVTAEDFVGRPDLVRGYVGPQGMEKVSTSPTRAWPARLDHRRQQGRHPRQERGRGPRLRGRRVRGRGRRAGRRPLPEVRHRPQAGPRHRDRAHLPVGPKDADALKLDVLGQKASRSASPWAPTASASPARWRPWPSSTPTTRAWLVPGGRPGRRACGRRGQGPADRAGPGRLREARRRRRPGPGRRPRRGLAGREVHRRGTDRRPADPGRRPSRRRGRRRAEGPPYRRTRGSDGGGGGRPPHGRPDPGPVRRPRAGPRTGERGDSPWPRPTHAVTVPRPEPAS